MDNFKSEDYKKIDFYVNPSGIYTYYYPDLSKLGFNLSKQEKSATFIVVREFPFFDNQEHIDIQIHNNLQGIGLGAELIKALVYQYGPKIIIKNRIVNKNLFKMLLKIEKEGYFKLYDEDDYFLIEEKHRRLNEGLLIENRVDFLRDKYIPILAKRFKYGKFDDELNIDNAHVSFDTIIELDPTTNKIYSQWLLNSIIKDDFNNFMYLNRFLQEDGYKYKEYLRIYHKIKNQLPIEIRDINKFTLGELKNIALKYKEKENEIGTKNEVLDKKYKIKDVLNYDVYMFKTSSEEDFKYYQLVSTNTQWCTRPNYKTFVEYIKTAPLIIFIGKTNRSIKFQYHMSTGQFMNEQDFPEHANLVSRLLGEFFSRVEIDGINPFLKIEVRPDFILGEKSVLGIKYKVKKHYNSILYKFNNSDFKFLFQDSDGSDGYINDFLYKNDLNLINHITNLLK